MRRLRALFLRLGGLIRKECRERELSAEIESHLALHIDDNIRAGMSLQEARREALMKLGGVEQTKEVYRDRRGLPLLETLLQDLRFGLRILRRNPGFTSVAVLTLALGIGANTAIFSVVNSVLLRPLSYRNPEQVYLIREIVPEWTRNYPVLPANLPDYQIWKKECRSFEEIALAEATDSDLSGSGEAEELHGARISANLLDLLGAQLTLGRSFLPEEDQAGHGNVVVLTDAFWRARFGGDPAIVGHSITLDGEPHTIVGVVSPSFHFPKEMGTMIKFGPRTDFFRPLGGARFNEQGLIGDFDFAAIARLKRGVQPAQAVAELNVVQAAIAKAANQDVHLRAEIVPLAEEIVGPARKGLLLLLAAVGAVLLIVCVNLSNLLLARVPSRMREAAIRTALGATRSNLVRQMLTESLLIAFLGGFLGTVLAVVGLRSLSLVAPVDLPRLDEVALDARVLFFALGLSTLVGILFGVLPGWRISRDAPQESLKTGAATATEGRGARRVREYLIGFEVSLCTALLILAGLLSASLLHVIRVHPGFAIDRVLAADVSLPSQGYTQLSARSHFYDQALAGIRALPGVQSAGWVTLLPLERQGSVSGISLPGDTSFKQGQENEALHASYRAVSPDYLRTMAIPLIQGRFFTENDRGKQLIIISKSLAERLWPGLDPVGRQCVGLWGFLQLKPSEVIGVVGDIRTVRLDEPPSLMVYLPDSYGQEAPGAPPSASFVIRAAGDPNVLASSVRGVIRNVDPAVPILALRPMTQVVSESVEARKFQALLSMVFASSALLLASIGIFGVGAYSVERRRQELGIRVALGASRTELLRLILSQGMAPVVIGFVLGIATALGVGRLMRSFLFEIKASDPLTILCVGAVVMFVALVACYFPARRAMHVDPMVALRYE
jgi:predicted permease